MTERGRGDLFCAAAIFYFVLLANYQFTQLSATVLGRAFLLSSALMSWAGALIGFYETKFSDWVLTFIALIPFEFSNPFLFLPSFSPIDYLGLAAILAMILKSDSKKLIDQFLSTFGALTLSAWLAFFIYALVASLWLHGNPRKDFRWVLFIVTFFIASRAFLETSRADVVRRVAQCLSVLGALIGAFSLFQFFHDGMNYGKVTATFRQHNSVGMYLSLCLPLSVSLIYTEEKKEMLLWSLLALLSFGGLVVSYSRGAWMGLLAGFFMVYLVAQVRGRRNTDLILFSLAVITCCFLARHYLRHDLSGRNLYWRAGIQIVHAHPFVGLGPGNYPSHIQSYLNAKETQVYLDDLLYNRGVYFWIHLHNLYLQILVEHGFLGASLFFLALAGVVQKAFGKFHSWQTQACRVSIIGFLVHNLVDITAVNSFDLLFAVLIALANSDAAGS